ncbi:MAG: type II secretion system protein [Oligoflexales bacterium]|nr:type II secretion system protein [Oligoflexales bacterium]
MTTDERGVQRLDSEKGTTLLELTVALGLVGIIALLSTTLYMNLESFSRKKSAEISARNESMLLLNELRKSYSIDIIDEADAPRMMLSEKDAVLGQVSDDGSTATVQIETTVSSAGEDLFSYTNKCTNLPMKLKGRVPKFDTAYLSKVFDKISLSYHPDAILRCMDYLEDFQCPDNQVPYVEYTSLTRNLYVPRHIAPNGRWRTSRSSAVAAFICETQHFEGDLRNIKDLTLITGTLDPSQRRNSDLTDRIKWKKYRMIMSVSSSSDNVMYLPRD